MMYRLSKIKNNQVGRERLHKRETERDLKLV